MTTRRRFLQAGTLGAACACVGGGWAFAQGQPQAKTSPTGKWICPPCGCASDGKDFDAPGACPSEGCGMLLIPKPATPPQGPGRL